MMRVNIKRDGVLVIDCNGIKYNFADDKNNAMEDSFNVICKTSIPFRHHVSDELRLVRCYFVSNNLKGEYIVDEFYESVIV